MSSTCTTPDFWLNLQHVLDLYDAMHSDTAAEIKKIQPALELARV